MDALMYTEANTYFITATNITIILECKNDIIMDGPTVLRWVSWDTCSIEIQQIQILLKTSPFETKQGTKLC